MKINSLILSKSTRALCSVYLVNQIQCLETQGQGIK